MHANNIPSTSDSPVVHATHKNLSLGNVQGRLVSPNINMQNASITITAKVSKYKSIETSREKKEDY